MAAPRTLQITSSSSHQPDPTVGFMVFCDCLMHIQPIQYDSLIHMQPMPFFLSAHLMHMQQIHIYNPDAYSADMAFSYLQTSVIFSRCRCTYLIHALPIRLQTGFLPIYNPQSCSADLEEAPMNNLNNPILLLFRHLVIARQAESSSENIGSYVDSRALYVSICTPSAVPLNRNERIRPVNGLHMHGLPNRTPFGVISRQCFQNFCRT